MIKVIIASESYNLIKTRKEKSFIILKLFNILITAYLNVSENSKII